ncbi:hypothetical protein BGZ99_009724 [Dissophora globulifera]|uniref:Galactose oxidase n=1 Tax=Dissophora globulifera TaxID=979702 RepID=A0A9P6UMV4_9FUNG|nr:hypothetical protein BGZ99_009724 [Dissophora globulifera]
MLFICRRCFGRQQQRRRLRSQLPNLKPAAASRRRRRAAVSTVFSSSSSALLATTLLLLDAMSPTALIRAQPAPSVFTPRYGAGSSLVDNTLYIIGGTTAVQAPFTASADTLAIPLGQAFTTSAIPWKRLQAGYSVQDARVSSTVDQKHLVLAGVGDQVGQLVVVYDIVSDQWTYLPSTAVGNVFPQTPRTSVSIALDTSTGEVILYGGIVATSSTNPSVKTYSLSLEFDFLDTRPTLSKWSWAAAIASSQPPPALAGPVMLYLPTLQRTIIMGGCNVISSIDGSVQQCVSFNNASLVNSMVMSSATGLYVPISTVELKGGSIPVPRLSPCAVVLANGDVFMYGGAGPNSSLGDAWVLSISDWTWTQVAMINAPFAGRAGATCQLVTSDQMILVGGYDGAYLGAKDFALPQVAIINTTSWSWVTDFTPGSLTEKTGSGDLSKGAIAGIVAGGTFLLVILLSIMGWLYWKRRQDRSYSQGKTKPFLSLRPSRSRQPLMESDTEISDEVMAGHDPSSTPMMPFKNHEDDRSGNLPYNHGFYNFSNRTIMGSKLHTGYQPGQQHIPIYKITSANGSLTSVIHGSISNSNSNSNSSTVFKSSGLAINTTTIVPEAGPNSGTSTPPRGSLEGRGGGKGRKVGSGSSGGGEERREREPFLIIPYIPDPSAIHAAVSSNPNSSSTFSQALSGSTDYSTLHSSPVSSNTALSSKYDEFMYPAGSQSSSPHTLPAPINKGYQLPQTLADIQRGQYVKTLEHQKQYERRKQEELQSQSTRGSLNRSGTTADHYSGHDLVSERIDLATGVIHLRDVDVGEEPARATANSWKNDDEDC